VRAYICRSNLKKIALQMLIIISTLTAGSCLFLSFLVGTTRQKTNLIANRCLAAFLFFLGIIIIDEPLINSGFYIRYPQFSGWNTLTHFAVAPALYMSVSYFVAFNRMFQLRDLVHFSPSLLYVIIQIVVTLMRKGNYVHNPDSSNSDQQIALIGLFFQAIFYWIGSFKKLQKHKKSVKNITSSPENVNLEWLKYILYGFALMLAFGFFETFNGFSTPIFSPLYLGFIYFMGYHAMQQKEIFPFSTQETDSISAILTENDGSTATPKKALFAPEEMASLKQKLNELMATQKPYLNHELTLPDLAKCLPLSTHELSHLINEGYGENFAQFVNRHRVIESKQLLLSDKHAHLSMVGIAYESGFNSKSAFYRVFKNFMGISPTEFREAESAVSSN
jgi:AraC-like DNA-binding protein